MSPNAKRFIKENDRSPVIAGAVIGEGGEGGHYTLMNGMSFTLNLQDCQALPKGYPKWHFR